MNVLLNMIVYLLSVVPSSYFIVLANKMMFLTISSFISYTFAAESSFIDCCFVVVYIINRTTHERLETRIRTYLLISKFDISLVRCAHSSDIDFNSTSPCIHVVLFIYGLF